MKHILSKQHMNRTKKKQIYLFNVNMSLYRFLLYVFIEIGFTFYLIYYFQINVQQQI